MGKAKSLNGKDLMLWISDKVVALSTSCKINLVANTVDSATKDDGFWDAAEIGNMSWSATNESVDSADENRDNDLVYDELFDLFVAGEPLKITVGLPTNANNDGGLKKAGQSPQKVCMRERLILPHWIEMQQKVVMEVSPYL